VNLLIIMSNWRVNDLGLAIARRGHCNNRVAGQANDLGIIQNGWNRSFGFKRTGDLGLSPLQDCGRRRHRSRIIQSSEEGPREGGCGCGGGESVRVEQVPCATPFTPFTPLTPCASGNCGGGRTRAIPVFSQC